MKSNQIIILILGLIIIVALTLIYLFSPESVEAPAEPEIETEIVTVGDGIEIEVAKGSIVKEIPVEVPGVERPNLDRVVNIPDTLPAEAREILATRIADTITTLKEDDSSLNDWITLGNLRNQIQDYEGAKEVHEYLNIVSPENFISPLNLGTLYHLHLKDFEKAEENFKESIRRNSTNEFSYVSLHDLYRYSYKQDTNLAEDTLLEGLSILADNLNLLKALAAYYESEDRLVEAKETYVKAIAASIESGDTAGAERLQEAHDAL